MGNGQSNVKMGLATNKKNILDKTRLKHDFIIKEIGHSLTMFFGGLYPQICLLGREGKADVPTKVLSD